MLDFLQKYQKIFFAVVTFAIVASFALFGVLDLYDRNAPKQQDREIGKLVDNSSMMMLDVRRLSRFIATDSEDLMYRTDVPVNLCNNGVIRRDLLHTGIADLLVAEYFDPLKEDLSQKLDRAKNYRSYQNPESPLVSARVVWERFIPAIPQGIDALKEQKEVSSSTFSELSKLFMQQSACPPELTRRFLSFYESQGTVSKPDPFLRHADLALFGFHSVSDWFGPNFVDMAAEFILNGAKIASQKGYEVTLAEAKADLQRNFQESLKKLPEKHRGSLSYFSHLRMLGFDEKEAENCWRNVLLFRRYFENASQAMIVDQLPYRDFASFSRESSSIQKYEWINGLDLKTGQDLIQFQVYLQAIGGKLNSIDLPRSPLSLEAIASKTPELVQTKYKAKLISTSCKHVGLRARAKEILDWQLESANWELLRSSFAFLKKARTNEERLVLLEALSKENRLQVDLFVRNKWVQANPFAVQEQLSQAKGEEREISISDSWVSMPEITKPKKFVQLFEGSSHSFEYQEGDAFYRFEEIEKVQEPQVLTFKEAKDLGVLEKLSHRFLEAEYKKIREEFPSQFQVKEGEWKAFFSVKEEVAYHVFADLFKTISKSKETLAYYASHRLEIPTKRALASLQKDPHDATWISLEKSEEPLLQQFKLIQSECLVPKMAEDEWMREKLLVMKPGEFSPISVPENGKISFFYFEKTNPANEPILEQITLGRELLGADAKRFVADKLLKKIKQKNAIVIPAKGEKDESI